MSKLESSPLVAAIDTDALTKDYDESGYNAMKPYKKDPFRAYSTVIGGFFYMMLPGCCYCTGVFSTYIQSYYGIPPTNHIT